MMVSLRPRRSERGAGDRIGRRGDGDTGRGCGLAHQRGDRSRLRSGWQTAEVDSLEHTHACLTLVNQGASQAVCYMTRDDALIAGHAALSVEAWEAEVLNAVDLTLLMDDAYDAVDRPQ